MFIYVFISGLHHVCLCVFFLVTKLNFFLQNKIES